MPSPDPSWAGRLTRPLPAAALVQPHIVDADARCRHIEAEPLPASVPQLLAEATADAPDRPVLHFIEDGRSFTYRQLSAQVAAFADGLSRLGVGRGTHVGVMLPNVPEFPISWLAIATLGAVMVPINIAYTGREFEYVTGDAQAEFLIVEREYADGAAASWIGDPRRAGRVVVRDEANARPVAATRGWQDVLESGSPDFLAAPPRASDLLNIQYTSGTTGFPKGCMLTQEYWLVAGKANAFRDGVVYERLLASTPFFYMDPQWLLMMSLFHRATLNVARRQSVSRFLGWLRDYRIQFCLFPQPLLQRPETGDERLPALRRANIYGLKPSLHAAAEKRFGINMREAFGMTEIGPAMFMPLSATDMIGSGSCGRPGPFRECRVVREDGTEAGAGEMGELQVRGRGILKGYYRNAEATRSAMDGDWFRTGDLFRRDERGYFRIVGRKKDMIRRSSENIPAREVEAVIMGLGGIAEVAAIPVPDPLRGEEVKICVVVDEAAAGGGRLTPEAIVAHAARELAPFKVPRYVEFRTALPKTPSGKIRKHELIAEKEDLRTGSWDRVDGIWR